MQVHFKEGGGEGEEKGGEEEYSKGQGEETTPGVPGWLS